MGGQLVLSRVLSVYGGSWISEGRFAPRLPLQKLEATTADYEYARLSLNAQVAKSWFMAVETRQQLAYANEVVELYEKTLNIVDAKYEFGDVGMKEVHLARADLAAAIERFRQVDEAHKIALRGEEEKQENYPFKGDFLL